MVEELAPPDLSVEKIAYSAFSMTRLEWILRKVGIEKLYIAGREDFIAMKCFAGGPQDLIDARSAYAAAPGPIDLDLLRIVTRRFGREAADRLQEVLAG